MSSKKEVAGSASFSVVTCSNTPIKEKIAGAALIIWQSIRSCNDV
jgi:hypothetical protein